MLYDHFTPMVLLALEDLGFCERGEAGDFSENGALEGPDGRLPVNTHGGQHSEAFIHGFNNVTEGVRQIRGTSTTQVPGRERRSSSPRPAATPPARSSYERD